MKKSVAEFWQYFLENISNIICNLAVNFAGFRNWQNTPCTVCYPAMDCLPHWYCWKVLPDGVIQHNFSQKWCHFTCLCTRASEGIFPRGPIGGFFLTFFYGGPKLVKFGFWHSKLPIKIFLLKFSNSCPSSNTRMLVC